MTADRAMRDELEMALTHSARFLESVFAGIQDGISVLDEEFTIICVNPAMERWYAHAAPLVGKKCYEAYHGATRPCEVCPTREALRTGEAARAEVPKRDAGGAVTGWFDLFSFPLTDVETGAVTGVIEHVRDISEAKRLGEALRRSEQLHRALFEQSPVGVFVYDDGLIIKECNERFAEMMQAPKEKLIGFDHHSARDQSLVPTVAAALHGEAAAYEGPYHTTVADNDKWIALRTSPLLGPDGSVAGGIGVVVDMTELKRTQEQVERLAFRDQLTDLPNRMLVGDRLAQAIAGAQRSQRKVGVVMLDLDRFKNVNDSLGHARGDELLRAVAGRLVRLVREVDTVARTGGDEFTLVLRDVKGARDIVPLGDKILSLFRQPFDALDREVYLAASMGVAVYPSDGAAAHELLENADTAMRRAKRDGGNTYRFYDESMNVRAAERLLLENELHLAIERQEFVAHYQPQIDLTDGAIVGVEALARWEHPQRGLVQPVEFIGFAEETGLIKPIGDWVLRLACTRARDWHRQTGIPFRLAVNLSPRQFQQRDIVRSISRALYDSGLQPEMLEIEVTETATMADLDQAVRVTKELRKMGVTIALDDFGTGFSSLAHLRRLPVNRLKIDRTFVSNLPGSADDAAITAAVIGLANNLGIEVLAEGVETVAQAGFLLRHGCNEAQGYLFSRPVPPEDLGRLLAGGRLKVSATV
jgi:diguanylate cyclase (GGDEF)-like protein/PAS domain S-box-containing protein